MSDQGLSSTKSWRNLIQNLTASVEFGTVHMEFHSEAEIRDGKVCARAGDNGGTAAVDMLCAKEKAHINSEMQSVLEL